MNRIRIRHVLPGIVALEALSLLSIEHPAAREPLFWALVAACAAIAFYRAQLLIAIAWAELVVGGMGYLFAGHIGGFTLSIREALFVLAMAATLTSMIRRRRIAFTASALWTPLSWFAFFLAWSVWHAFRSAAPAHDILFDAKHYLFFAYVFAWYECMQGARSARALLRPFCIASVAYLAFKTLALYFIFSHSVPLNTELIYRWVRDTGVGELTPLPTGIYRIFFYSHIYLAAGWLFVCVADLKERSRARKLWYGAAGACIAASLAASMSRSLWAAAAASTVLLYIAASVWWRMSVRDAAYACARSLAYAMAGILLLIGITYIPYPAPSTFSLFHSLAGRLTISDASGATRWAELGPLWQAVRHNWILGAGFGAKVTYISNDPRVRAQAATGEYATFAFEWGYLDIWLKMGIFGLLAYLLIIKKIVARLARETIQRAVEDRWDELLYPAGILAAVCALAIAHIFTPYLNHPLGIGIIIVAAFWIDRSGQI